jgi:hypothetical protein
VVEVAKELVEAVHRGQELVPVTQVVLAELPRGVAHLLEHRGDGGRRRRHADRRAGLSDRSHPSPDRKLAGDKVGPTRRAARLGVVIGEDRAFGRQLVDVGRPPCHQAAVVGADVPHADVVTHDDDNVRLGTLTLLTPRIRGTTREHQCRQEDEDRGFDSFHCLFHDESSILWQAASRSERVR